MRFRLPALARRERGTSYTLPFLLVVPFYLTFVLAVFEVGFLLLAQTGTQYAAHAAGRSAVVWRSADDPEAADRQVTRAAWTGLAPYAVVRPGDDPGLLPPGAAEASQQFAAAHPRAGELLGRKFRTVAPRTTVEVEELAPEDPHGLLRVTVRYRAPLLFPVISRVLDPDGRRPFEYPLSATVTFPSEAPESADGTLGIGYAPAAAKE